MQAADRAPSQGSAEEFQVPPVVVRQHDRLLLSQRSKGHLAETESTLQLSFIGLQMHKAIYAVDMVSEMFLACSYCYASSCRCQYCACMDG